MDEETITSWLSDYLNAGGAGIRIEADTRLLDDVGMDSLQIVELVAFLETTFDVSVPGEALTPENFETVAAIRRMVEDLRSPDR